MSEDGQCGATDPRLLAAAYRARVAEIDASLRELMAELGRSARLSDSGLRPLGVLLEERRRALAELGELALVHELVQAGAGVAAPPAPPAAPLDEPEGEAEVEPDDDDEPEALDEPGEQLDTGRPATAPVPPRAKPVATASDLLAFQRRFEARKLGSAAGARPVSDAERSLSQLLRKLGEVPVLHTEHDAERELDHLSQNVEPEARALWSRLPREQQVSFIGILVARMRAAQLRLGTTSGGRFLVETLRDYLSTVRPGVVHGLALHHSPTGESWREDAEALLRGLHPRVSAAGRVSRPPAPKGAAQSGRVTLIGHGGAPASAAADDEDEDDEPVSGADALADWVHRDLLQGKSALMFGGDKRVEAAEALRESFQLTSVDWCEGGRPRQTDSMVARIEGGQYGVVMINKFVSHKDGRRIIKACKQAGVPYAVIRRGFGVHAVKSAFDMALTGPVSAPGGAPS